MRWTWATPAPRTTYPIDRIYSFTPVDARWEGHFRWFRRASSSNSTRPTGFQEQTRLQVDHSWPFLVFLQGSRNPILVPLDGLAECIEYCGYTAGQGREWAQYLSSGSVGTMHVNGVQPEAAGPSPIVLLMDLAPLRDYLTRRDEGMPSMLCGQEVRYMVEGAQLSDDGEQYSIFPTSLDHYVGELADGTRFVTSLAAVTEWLRACGQNIPDDLEPAESVRF
jgi:hypothetical protein